MEKRARRLEIFRPQQKIFKKTAQPAASFLIGSESKLHPTATMSDSKAPAADAAAPAKKKRAASKSKSAAKAPAGGTYQAYIVDAIKSLKERGGSSRQAIKAYVQQNNKVRSVAACMRERARVPAFFCFCLVLFPPKFKQHAAARLLAVAGPRCSGRVCCWDGAGWSGAGPVSFGTVCCWWRALELWVLLHVLTVWCDLVCGVVWYVRRWLLRRRSNALSAPH
jgi:hypothetical protein